MKIMQAMSEDKLEQKVNEFISNPNITVKELQFRASVFYFAVMISYED